MFWVRGSTNSDSDPRQTLDLLILNNSWFERVKRMHRDGTTHTLLKHRRYKITMATVNKWKWTTSTPWNETGSSHMVALKALLDGGNPAAMTIKEKGVMVESYRWLNMPFLFNIVIQSDTYFSENLRNRTEHQSHLFWHNSTGENIFWIQLQIKPRNIIKSCNACSAENIQDWSRSRVGYII